MDDGEITQALPVVSWRGEFRFTPFQVGDPGLAAGARSLPDVENWDHRDTVLDGVRLAGPEGLPPMELRAASTRGRSHRFYGKVRQDAYSYRSDGTFVVAVVADGVSSGPLSHLASNVVSRHGAQLLLEWLRGTPPELIDWAQVLRILSAKVIGVGRRRLQELRPDLVEPSQEDIAKQLSTTALFAIVDMRAVDGYRPVHTLAYGDSSAWVLRDGGRWESPQPIKNQDAVVASSATAALPYLPAVAPVAVSGFLAPQDVLVLVTDGIGDPLDDGSGAVGAFLAEQWRRPPEPLAFAAHVDFARRSHDDDRTALGLWSVEG